MLGWLPEKDHLLPKTMKRTEPAKQSHQVEPAVSDFPSIAEIPPSSWGLFANECFFVTGFSPEMDAYLLHLICAGAGQRHPVLSERVSKAVLGPRSDHK